MVGNGDGGGGGSEGDGVGDGGEGDGVGDGGDGGGLVGSPPELSGTARNSMSPLIT
jgi:hypothetical protein